jgi:phosphoglycerate kinase
MMTVLDAQVKLKPVFYRVDYNVPIKNGVVVDDFRLRATVPTLDYLLKEEARVIIGTHLGRPGGKYDAEFSLKPVAQHLMGYYDSVQVQFTDAVVGPEINEAVARMKPGSILFLGNLRFNPGEEANDFQFAKQLSELAEIYVSDAFGEAHRNTASIAQLPQLLESYPGALLAKEVASLKRLREMPNRPFTALVGGAKLETKVELVESLLEKADYVLVGGGVANTFLKASGVDVGASLVNDDLLPAAKRILMKSQGKLVLPVDFVRDTAGQQWRFVDIGPQTVALFTRYLMGSKEIFWNGTVGIAEQARFANGTKQLTYALAGMGGLVTVAGGDTVAFIKQENLTEKFHWLSTGGGSALAYIAGQELPGLKVLKLA